MENMRLAATEQKVTVKKKKWQQWCRIRADDSPSRWLTVFWGGRTLLSEEEMCRANNTLHSSRKGVANWSFKVSISWTRHRQPHCHVLQPHSFQLKATNSSVIILFSTVLELTSSGILMASFDTEEIPTHVFRQLIATQKQSVLICSRQETYVLCYCVSYWRKHTGRQLRPSCRSL